MTIKLNKTDRTRAVNAFRIALAKSRMDALMGEPSTATEPMLIHINAAFEDIERQTPQASLKRLIKLRDEEAEILKGYHQKDSRQPHTITEVMKFFAERLSLVNYNRVPGMIASDSHVEQFLQNLGWRIPVMKVSVGCNSYHLPLVGVDRKRLVMVRESYPGEKFYHLHGDLIVPMQKLDNLVTRLIFEEPKELVSGFRAEVFRCGTFDDLVELWPAAKEREAMICPRPGKPQPTINLPAKNYEAVRKLSAVLAGVP